MLIGHQPKEFLLAVEALTVSFDGFKAVNDLSFYVEENEIRVIIGPNGAGKTTVLDLICGKTKATSGSIQFRGQELTRNEGESDRTDRRSAASSRRHQCSSISRCSRTWRFRTRAAAPCSVRWLSSATPRYATASRKSAEMIFLKDRLDTYADELSHGQKQWLEIGMLLIQDPDLLMLDEPVAGMSVSERAKTA
jgi:urea transport system ATP-binding protein